MTRLYFRIKDNYVGVRSNYNYYGNEDLYMKNKVVHVHVYRQTLYMCPNHYIPFCRSMIP